MGRSSTDSTNQYNLTGNTVNSQLKQAMDNRKQCPHCPRMFSDEAAQRHFPICERNSHSSKLMVVRDNSAAAKAKVGGGVFPRLNRKLSK